MSTLSLEAINFPDEIFLHRIIRFAQFRIHKIAARFEFNPIDVVFFFVEVVLILFLLVIFLIEVFSICSLVVGDIVGVDFLMVTMIAIFFFCRGNIIDVVVAFSRTYRMKLVGC